MVRSLKGKHVLYGVILHGDLGIGPLRVRYSIPCTNNITSVEIFGHQEIISRTGGVNSYLSLVSGQLSRVPSTRLTLN